MTPIRHEGVTLSVVMPVHNEAAHLRDAIGSILNQTFPRFDLIIINDGSTDGSVAIVKEFDDPRIVVMDRPHRGLVASLNEGLAAARGTYVARMDGDDISLPERFARQTAFLDEHPDVAIVGSSIGLIDEDGRPAGRRAMLTRDVDIRRQAFYASPFAHGSVMFRRRVLQEVGGYAEPAWPAEDYDLWLRIVLRHKAANLAGVFYQYRVHPDCVSSVHEGMQRQRLDERRRQVWARRKLHAFGWKEVSAGSRHYRALDRESGLALRHRFLVDQYVLSMIQARQRRFRSAFVNLAAAVWNDPRLAITLARPALFASACRFLLGGRRTAGAAAGARSTA